MFFPFGYGFGMDPTWLVIIPGIILALVAQAAVNRAFNKYSQINSNSGLVASNAVRRMLDENGLDTVQVRPQQGRLTDNYDPRNRTLNLSQSVYGSSSLAALGVAAHEAGHALQHKNHYAPMALRTYLVPVANVGSYAAWPLLIIGLFMSFQPLIYAGVIVFGAAVLFQIVTLPVEIDASRRGLQMLREGGYLAEEEVVGARKVLTAAAMTYLAATLMAILQFLRLLLIANGSSRRRN